VRLAPQMAHSLTKVLRELATHAAKDGALARDDGHVELTWLVKEKQKLQLQWKERNGPPVLPPTRKGFGSRPVERRLAAGASRQDRAASEPAGAAVVLEFCRSPGRERGHLRPRRPPRLLTAAGRNFRGESQKALPPTAAVRLAGMGRSSGDIEAATSAAPFSEWFFAIANQTAPVATARANVPAFQARIAVLQLDVLKSRPQRTLEKAMPGRWFGM
jgi:hypothetical protein